MRIFIVALMSALSLAGVLRLSRASVPVSPAPALAVLPQAPLRQASVPLQDAESAAAKPVRVEQALDASPTGTIPPEQPRLLKPKKKLVTPAMIPPPPLRPKSLARTKGGHASAKRPAQALSSGSSRR
jgi:hypothetical protein